VYDAVLLRNHIKWAEAADGPELFPYRDTVGILTIGYGRNLIHNGITKDEAELMLTNDINSARMDAASLPFWLSLSPPRKMVIIDMVYNLGLTKFRGFKNLNKALGMADWNLAALEMKDSRWYLQTERRAKVLVKAMQTGKWNNA
jgi:lysozyme